MVSVANEKCLSFRGLSGDEKPVNESVGNGSIFIEMDTSKIFMFDAEAKEWLETSFTSIL